MKTRSVVTEVGVFSVFMGLVLGVLALVTITGIDPSAPPFMGMPRAWGLGVPIGVVATFNLLAGIALLILRNRATVIACLAAGICIPVVYFGIMVLSGAGIGINLISGLMILIPIVAVARGRLAWAEIG